MTYFLIAAALAALASGSGGALPDELAYLESLVGEQAKLVDAVRKFDRQQMVFAEWDNELAKAHAEAGEDQLAEEKLKQARKRYQMVRDAYEFVNRNYRNDVRAQTYYGELLYDHFGEVSGAVQAWILATSLDKKFAPAFNDLAIHYCHTGDYKSGLGCYEKALKLEPSNPDFIFNLVQAYLIHFPDVCAVKKWDKPKLYNEAMRLSKRACDLDRADFELAQDYAVNFFAAVNFGVEADWKRAAAAWQETRKRARTPDETFYTWLNECRSWMNAYNPDEALACVDQALAIRPASPAALNLKEDIRTGGAEEPPKKKKKK